MNHPIVAAVLAGGGVFGAFVACLAVVIAMQLTARRGWGYVHLVFYGILLVGALTSLSSGRDLTSTALMLTAPPAEVRHPLVALIQPLVSLFILTVCGERLLSRWLRPADAARVPMALLLAYLLFWLGTIAAPALLGSHPKLAHEFLYPLVIGLAMLVASGVERDLAFRAARNALFVFIALGLLLMPLLPRLVMDGAYNQGLLPGVPRLAGLAPHAVSLGLLSQLALLCLQARPFERRWLDRLMWLIGLSSLFLAQSKTAWIAFVLCSSCLLLLRRGPAFVRRATDPVRPELGLLTVTCLMAAVTAACLLVMFGDIGGRIAEFLSTPEGAQLSSLTGRDRIWEIARQEWARSPVFGYGLTIWDADFRAAIGMPNATHAHNQFMDTLSRSGSVGAAALVLYALVLLVQSVRYARITGGLSLALFLALALRSVSEVPLLLVGYGPELLAQLLLLMTLSAAAGHARVTLPERQAALREQRAALRPRSFPVARDLRVGGAA
ncbi:MAG: O-antigen ligase domain-containing protein [Comamonadaceae bacterium]|nr:MAG: O-antigen ligase domain-containing protein [Comamonadaceae bacterium]